MKDGNCFIEQLIIIYEGPKNIIYFFLTYNYNKIIEESIHLLY